MGVELTRLFMNGEPIPIELNLSKVLFVEDHEMGTAVYFSTREYIIVRETRNEIRRKVMG